MTPANGSETNATIYMRLRERSVALARLWALAEFCRIGFVTATFCWPWVALVYLVFEASEQSLGHVARLFIAWQLYAAMLVPAVAYCAFWQLAARVTRRIERVLPEPQEDSATAPD